MSRGDKIASLNTMQTSNLCHRFRYGGWAARKGRGSATAAALDSGRRATDVWASRRLEPAPVTRKQRIILFVLGLAAALPLFQQGWAGLNTLLQPTPVVAQVVLPKPGPADKLDLVTASGVHRFDVEIAADDAARAEGLMFRQSMADDHGMLFDFKREQPVAFWMKNTFIALDMVFVRADGTVVTVAENTVPQTETSVPSGAPVRFVLEVNAGTTRKIGLKPGDKMVHQLVRPAP